MADEKPPTNLRVLTMIGVIILTIPALMIRGGDLEFGAGWDALLFGLAILGAAFMLSWAAEVVRWTSPRVSPWRWWPYRRPAGIRRRGGIRLESGT